MNSYAMPRFSRSIMTMGWGVDVTLTLSLASVLLEASRRETEQRSPQLQLGSHDIDETRNTPSSALGIGASPPHRNISTPVSRLTGRFVALPVATDYDRGRYHRNRSLESESLSLFGVGGRSVSEFESESESVSA